ncbi:MAG: hypothetical protein HY791_17125 [Deltaproteobacteria bacterium]|nr:hypothetical protein [Deltaproteobacteria bacterium]
MVIRNDPNRIRLPQTPSTSAPAATKTVKEPSSQGSVSSPGMPPRAHKSDKSEAQAPTTRATFTQKLVSLLRDHQRPVMGVMLGVMAAPGILGGVAHAQPAAPTATTDAEFDAAKLTQYPLFKLFWETPEGTNDGMAHRGLDELTPQGAANLVEYARTHNIDGTPSPAGQKAISKPERDLIRAILEHPHFGGFFELDSKPGLLEGFGIDPGSVHASTSQSVVDLGDVNIPRGVSEKSPAELRSLRIENLGKKLTSEYDSRKDYFEDPSVGEHTKGLRVLGLLADYAEALNSHGTTASSDDAGITLFNAFAKLPFAHVYGAQDYNGLGFGIAQSLVLGFDGNEVATKFDVNPDAPTTYLSMDGGMAKAMEFVDQYREALGQDKGAADYERAPVLNYMVGGESGHKKFGSFDEKRAFSTSGVNWGVIMFPGDQEIAKLPPAASFDMAIDAVDALKRAVIATPGQDHLVVVDKNGQELKIEKQIQKDENGKAVSWSAVFKDANGQEVPAGDVLGLIKNAWGQTRGDGKAAGTLDMGWWGFCDRNTAQRLYKSKYKIPQIDAETVRVEVNGKIISIPRDEAQKLLDVDVGDLVGRTKFVGFRFDDQPKTIRLTTGETITGRIQDFRLDVRSAADRVGGDLVRVRNDANNPIRGNIELKTEYGSQSIAIGSIKEMTKDAAGKVTIDIQHPGSTYSSKYSGTVTSPIDWSSATPVEGSEGTVKLDPSKLSGELVVQTASGEKRIPASQVSEVVGETEHELRVSSYVKFVSDNGGMFATDGSTGVVVSNGVRWVNEIQRKVVTDTLPDWMPKSAQGIMGPLTRVEGDKLVLVEGMYKNYGDSMYPAFRGWMQVGQDGGIINEGFVSGEPDFGWAANDKLDWGASSSFNPHMTPELRLKLLVNGVKDMTKLEAMAEKLNLPENWKSLRVADAPAPTATETPTPATP